MPKGIFVVVALAALLAPSLAEGARTSRELLPGLTYIRQSGAMYGRPVVLRALLGPRPGGLYALKPVLSNGVVQARETVTSMQRRLSARATLAGVNGDFFNWEHGYPSGIFVARGALQSRPLRARSSLGIGRDGVLRIGRVGYFGRWGPEGSALRRRHEFNRPLRRANGLALFVPSWGRYTPRTGNVREAVLRGFSRLYPNRQRSALVVAHRRRGGHPIPRDGAVLQARGQAKAVLRRIARAGQTLSFRLGLDPWWERVPAALGGGPVLVRAGVPIFRAGEAFRPYQLRPRHARTAVGQLADGRILLVTVDGRSRSSSGLTNTQLAREMFRLGAVEAMALDAGGSSTMAFNGSLLNLPSDGRERSVAESLQFFYYGIYTPAPRYRSFSPNGDGAADVQRLYAKVPRRSLLDIRLIRPDGATGWRWQGAFGPGRYVKTLRRRSLAQGDWRWVVRASDDRGRHSSMQRRFTVNKTLGFLELSKRRLRVSAHRGGRIVASFRLAQTATVSVSIRGYRGSLVRTLVRGQPLSTGRYAVVWNGRNHLGRVVRSGIFRVFVRAGNALGPTSLTKSFTVVRVRSRTGPGTSRS